MKSIKPIFSVILFLFIFNLPSFGEENKDKEKNDIENQEQQKKTKLLSADEFSKAFSKPKYKNKLDTEKEEIKEELPYAVDELGKSEFANKEYKDITTPKNTLAASIPEKHKYSWLPRWHFSGKGEVFLPGNAISHDRSLLVILEKIPHENANDGTIAVIINTYNWTITRIHYYKDRLFTKIFFRPGSKQLVAWEEYQNDKIFKKIHLINIKSGKIISSSREIKDPLSGIAIDKSGNKVYLKTVNNTKKIYIFELDNLTEKPSKRKCSAEKGNIAVSENSLVFAGKDNIVEYKLNSTQKVFNLENKSNIIPECITFAGNNEKLAFSSYMKPVTISVGNRSRQLSNAAGQVIFYRKDIDLLAFEEYKNRQITFFSMSKQETVAKLIPAKIKPKTNAGALFLSYLPHMERYVVLDTHGTLCLYHKPGKKWRKKILFSAKK